ncbi:MAG: hypothetical protein HQK51_06165, partial [Oligoflexia bacterium]|nr:hypothetical protein [Oligoflexia bacterium]
IPLNTFSSLLSPQNLELSKCTSNFNFLGIIFIGLLIKRKKVLPASFMYFRNKTFNRITDYSWFNYDITPDNATILVSEVTAMETSDKWKNYIETQKTVIQEIIGENIISEEDIIQVHTYFAPHAYPIYKLGFQKHLDYFNSSLQKYKNIFSIGRQGSFAYINTHIAFKMGFNLARNVTEIDNHGQIMKKETTQIKKWSFTKSFYFKDCLFKVRSVVSSDLEDLRMWKNNNRHAFFLKDEITKEQQEKWFAMFEKDNSQEMFICELDNK